MIIGITGSRKFTDTDCMEQAILEMKPSLLLTGGAAGADTIAEGIARKHGIPCKVYLPAFKTDATIKYHPRWYLERNKEIVDACDVLLAFFAGEKSKGTEYTVEYAKKISKPIKVFPKNEQRQTFFHAELF